MSSRHNLTALTLDDCSLCVCGHTGQLHRGGADCGIGTCRCERFQAMTQPAELAALDDNGRDGGVVDAGALNAPASEAVRAEALTTIVGSIPTPDPIIQITPEPEPIVLNPTPIPVNPTELPIEESLTQAVVEALASPKDNHCLRCGHDWDTSEKMKSKGNLPVACPLCRSAYWDKPAEMQTASTPSPERRVDLFDRQKGAQATRRRRLLERRLLSSMHELGLDVVRSLIPSAFPPRPSPEIIERFMFPSRKVGAVEGKLPPPPTFEDGQ